MTHKLLVILHCLFVVTDTQHSSHLVGVAFGKSPAALLSVTSLERVSYQHPAWSSDLKHGEGLTVSHPNTVSYRHFTKAVKLGHFCSLDEYASEPHGVCVYACAHKPGERAGKTLTRAVTWL